MQFVPGLTHPQPAQGKRWLVVHGHKVLTRRGQFLFEEPLSDAALITLKVGQLWAQGQWLDCYCCLVDEAAQRFVAADIGEFVGLRSLLLNAAEAEFLLAGAAVQLANWYADHTYCGRCGQANSMRTDDRAMHCLACDLRHYPRLSPCVIMLITRGDSCLLAVHARAQQPMYTALAGFVEAGESLEAAVAREAAEEVGLSVNAVRYVGSQPWPFPGQLMVGFHASLAPDSGPLVLQDEEISAAGWYRYDQLPPLTPPIQTLSGQLIAKFVADCKSRYG